MVLLTMPLIWVWFHLSDVGTEAFMKDSMNFTAFCGRDMEDAVPDHSRLSRFGWEWTVPKRYQRIMDEVNRQLTAKKGMIQGTAVVEARITASPFPRKANPKRWLKIEKKRSVKIMRNQKKSVLTPIMKPAGSKKGKNLRDGYQRHIATTEKGSI